MFLILTWTRQKRHPNARPASSSSSAAGVLAMKVVDITGAAACAELE